MSDTPIKVYAASISEHIRQLTELSGEIDALINTLRAGEETLAKDYADLANAAEARIKTIRDTLAAVTER